MSSGSFRHDPPDPDDPGEEPQLNLEATSSSSSLPQSSSDSPQMFLITVASSSDTSSQPSSDTLPEQSNDTLQPTAADTMPHIPNGDHPQYSDGPRIYLITATTSGEIAEPSSNDSRDSVPSRNATLQPTLNILPSLAENPQPPLGIPQQILRIPSANENTRPARRMRNFSIRHRQAAYFQRLHFVPPRNATPVSYSVSNLPRPYYLRSIDEIPGLNEAIRNRQSQVVGRRLNLELGLSFLGSRSPPQRLLSINMIAPIDESSTLVAILRSED